MRLALLDCGYSSFFAALTFSLAFLAAALSLIVIAIGGYFFNNRASTTQRPRPLLEVTPESLDFGKVDATTDFPWKLRVTNVSSRTVQIADIRASCGCTQVTPSSFGMEPGESRDVELRMNLREESVTLSAPANL